MGTWYPGRWGRFCALSSILRRFTARSLGLLGGSGLASGFLFFHLATEFGYHFTALVGHEPHQGNHGDISGDNPQGDAPTIHVFPAPVMKDRWAKSSKGQTTYFNTSCQPVARPFGGTASRAGENEELRR